MGTPGQMRVIPIAQKARQPFHPAAGIDEIRIEDFHQIRRADLLEEILNPSTEPLDVIGGRHADNPRRSATPGSSRIPFPSSGHPLFQLERFRWEERNGVADSFARRGKSEAQADGRHLVATRTERITKLLQKKAKPARPIHLQSFPISAKHGPATHRLPGARPPGNHARNPAS